MTLKTLREQQRAERAAYVIALIAQAGSVRQAAKLANIDRAYFRRLRRAGTKEPILTAPAPPRTS